MTPMITLAMRRANTIWARGPKPRFRWAAALSALHHIEPISAPEPHARQTQ
jgi:hypothetical protein